MAVNDLAARVGAPAADIRVVRADRVTWRDSAAGCPEPGMFYAQVLTPGYWIMLSYRGTEYDYRGTNTQVRQCPSERRQSPAGG